MWTRFDVHRKASRSGDSNHHYSATCVENALAVIAAGTRAGLTPATLAEGLRQFKGTADA